ncbi:MAG: peptidyl-prolyl cis-trans isomerase SurA [Chloroflexota bacterium]|jgi:parvulin-like peptidyl-prolyl isomerase|nr:peptidyl-prolyl cis-trans isomerase SurA [Chloroflexota bacterium]
MTIRVRPDSGRSGRDTNRRTFYTNLAFGGTVVVAILILVIVGITSWYGAHLAAAATVDGQTITKDQFIDRATVEVFRLRQLSARVNAELAAGRLTAAQASSRIDQVNQQLDDSQLAFTSTIVEKMIDTNLQAKYANELGVAVTPEQVDARILEDKTRKEERHVWLIALKPEVTAPATEPTATQKAAARKKADDALAAVKGGKAFADVAKEVSTDATKANGGDSGWLDAAAVEQGDWQAALFKLEVNGLTDVILGADGIYRIGTVTEIVAPQVDQTWDQKMVDAKVKPEAYRAAITSEVLRTALGDKLIADASVAGPQRQVQELYIKAPASPPGEKAIKVRHILYSPKDDPQGAATLPETDPEWTKAQLAAQKAYDTLKADPSKFDAIARAESDESSATGVDGSGGKLPYFDTSSQVDDAFAAAIFADGLKPGDLLAPFKSSFGWHVVQVMYFPPDADEMARLKAQAATPGTDFGQLVKDFSEGATAGKGGDIGWVAKGTLDDRLTDVILKTPAGSFTDVIEVKDDGLYLVKVLNERTQAPDAEQLKTIKASAFGNWYSGKKAAATITRNLLGS